MASALHDAKRKGKWNLQYAKPQYRQRRARQNGRERKARQMLRLMEVGKLGRDKSVESMVALGLRLWEY